MSLFEKIQAKRELKRQQKQKTIEELKHEIYVKNAKIDILEERILETTPVGIMETATSCLICGEDVTVYGYEAEHGCYKICDKCKQAVMKIRTQLEKKKQKEKASTPNNICAMH